MSTLLNNVLQKCSQQEKLFTSKTPFPSLCQEQKEHNTETLFQVEIKVEIRLPQWHNTLHNNTKALAHSKRYLQKERVQHGTFGQKNEVCFEISVGTLCKKI